MYESVNPPESSYKTSFRVGCVILDSIRDLRLDFGTYSVHVAYPTLFGRELVQQIRFRSRTVCRTISDARDFMNNSGLVPSFP